MVLGSRIYGFTGREYETNTGLYYYRARYYNPAIGRFLQTDPIGYYDSLNLYQYCGNNPVNWTDPWGLYANVSVMIVDLLRDISDKDCPDSPVDEPGDEYRPEQPTNSRTLFDDVVEWSDWRQSHPYDGEQARVPGGGGVVVPGSETVHMKPGHGYPNGHRHWLEYHKDPKTGKGRIVRRTGPLNPCPKSP